MTSDREPEPEPEPEPDPSEVADAALAALFLRAWLAARFAVEVALVEGVTSRAALRVVILRSLRPLHIPRALAHIGRKILVGAVDVVKRLTGRSASIRALGRITTAWVHEVREVLVRTLVGPTTPRSATRSMLSLVREALERGADAAKELVRVSVKAARRVKAVGRIMGRRFVGQANKAVQKAVGLRRYVWRTCRDNRVRDTHRAREGKTYSWDDPPRGGHPGEDWNCRCWARPVFAPI